MEKTKLMLLLLLCMFFTGTAVAKNVLPYQAISMEEKGDRYDILIEYPQVKVSEETSDKIKAINKAFLEWMEKTIMFKIPEIRVENTLDYDGEFKDFWKNSYNVEFHIDSFSENIISIKFERYWYYIGAVHGYSSVRTFNYDPEEGRVIQLKDIFTEGSDYLDQISEYVIRELIEQYKKEEHAIVLEEAVKDGASPKEENFDSFSLSEDSLIIYFDDYEVGSYSVGLRVVAIPYSELTGITLYFMEQIRAKQNRK